MITDIRNFYADNAEAQCTSEPKDVNVVLAEIMAGLKVKGGDSKDDRTREGDQVGQ